MITKYFRRGWIRIKGNITHHKGIVYVDGNPHRVVEVYHPDPRTSEVLLEPRES